MKKLFGLFFIMALGTNTLAQELTHEEEDSIFVSDYETHALPPKVLHAEPLFIDLIRDLGARKGEREWNFAGGVTDFNEAFVYEYLVEYEWAVIDRLGLEVEIPAFSVNSFGTLDSDSVYTNSIESFKAAIQWSYFVNPKISTSLALGYINELVVGEPGVKKRGNFIWGNLFNPFMVLAKRWGNNFHTLVYTGPRWLYEFDNGHTEFEYEINYNFHYMIPTTDNFIGVEINQNIYDGKSLTVIRPQMRVDIARKWMAGLVVGVPTSFDEERMSFFIRLIYEPTEFEDH